MANELTELATPDGSSNKKKMDKGKLVLIGIGFMTLIVTYLLYKRSQGGAAPTQAQASVDPNTGLPYSANPGMSFGQSGVPTDFGSLNTNLNALIASEGALTTQLTNALSPPQGSSVTPSYTDLTGEIQQGLGFQFGGGFANTMQPIVTSQGTFQWLSSAPAASAFEKSGGTLYYQAQPGNFVQTTYQNWAQNLGGQTALYAQNPNAPKSTLPVTTAAGH